MSIDSLIIHNKCGLPIEFCECEDAQVYYDWEIHRFIVKEEPCPVEAKEAAKAVEVGGRSETR
jgi:hypothetical protein